MNKKGLVIGIIAILLILAVGFYIFLTITGGNTENSNASLSSSAESGESVSVISGNSQERTVTLRI